MKKEMEELIVKSFFEKNVQERVLHELFTPKKRDHALNRLCHEYQRMLKGKYMIEIPPPNSDPDDIYELLMKNGAEKMCYSLSHSEKVDGKELPLQEVLEHAVGFGFPSIISCIPGELAYFEAEQANGSPPRFILKRPKMN
ncbi:hypothetical protein SAMN04487975_11123 [Planococcus glaciei]|uniref:hypothetical protein n=1 Tax=Planococcus glaciei TaxID=459472 RepID=UPI0008829A6A|nr:hypothetical protein [Planococcus glaciei]SDI03166.1 hypothetical protein SAMN04487975_11123 [Planococcus glaciei]